MPKREKKRWMTANQIRDAIDEYKARAQNLMDTAATQDLKADRLYETQDPRLAEDASFAREQAKKMRRSAQRIYEIKLVKLKQRLAEWSTELLPGVISDGDRSIQR